MKLNTLTNKDSGKQILYTNQNQLRYNHKGILMMSLLPLLIFNIYVTYWLDLIIQVQEAWHRWTVKSHLINPRNNNNNIYTCIPWILSALWLTFLMASSIFNPSSIIRRFVSRLFIVGHADVCFDTRGSYFVSHNVVKSVLQDGW